MANVISDETMEYVGILAKLELSDADAAFLGCYESSYITGTQIVIDGGSTLPETTSMGQ